MFFSLLLNNFASNHNKVSDQLGPAAKSIEAFAGGVMGKVSFIYAFVGSMMLDLKVRYICNTLSKTALQDDDGGLKFPFCQAR